MNITYPARRILALFQAHEALPHDPLFVAQTVGTLVSAECSSFFGQGVPWNDALSLHRFEHDLMATLRDLYAQQVLTVVQDVRVGLPHHHEAPKDEITVNYRLMFSTSSYKLTIPYLYMVHAVRDQVLTRGRSAIDEWYKFQKEKK